MEKKAGFASWIWVAVVVAVLYLADAAYPSWEWNCRVQGNLGLMASIPEVDNDPQIGGPFRHLNLTVPAGCKATPHNTLRKTIEWAFG